MNHISLHNHTASATLQDMMAPRSKTGVSATDKSADQDFGAIFHAVTSERGTVIPSTTDTSSTDTTTPSSTSTSNSTASTGTSDASTASALNFVQAMVAGDSASATAASTTSTTADTATSSTTTTPGIQALVSAIINGSFQPSYVTDLSKLAQSTPAGVAYMPSSDYASDDTAQQLAQLLGGTVVQRPPFGVDPGMSEPDANFIQLPNGMTFNAADVAYYARCGGVGAAQLTADITQTINAGSAWTNYYQNGGTIPTFATGYVGPPISGMTYPAGSIGADGNVINPDFQTSTTQGT